MITRVLDAQGRIIHDCIREGCDNSWDGYSLRDGVKVQTGVAIDGVTAAYATINKDSALPGRSEPDANAWTIAGNRATLKKNGG